MSDDDFERFSRSDDARLRGPTRSASLDRPPQGARERILARVLAEPRVRRSGPLRAGSVGALAGLGVGAAAAFFLAGQATGPKPPTPLTPESLEERRAPSVAVRPAAPSASTAPAASSTASTPLPPCPTVVVAAGKQALFDDFEDGNARLFAAEGRAGTWRTNAPPGTKLTPPAGSLAFPVAIPGGRGGSRKALHFVAPRFAQGGAGIVADPAPGRCYDASAYAGVGFFARGKSRLTFRVTMIDAMEKRWGGLCETNCYDAHSKAVALTGDFVHYEVRWDELEQAGYGTPVAFDPRRILLVDFTVDAADSPFDIWIDDVAFLPR